MDNVIRKKKGSSKQAAKASKKQITDIKLKPPN